MLGDDKIMELQARNRRLTEKNNQLELMVQALQAEFDATAEAKVLSENKLWELDNKTSRQIHKLMVDNRGLRERIDHYQNIVDIKDDIINSLMGRETKTIVMPDWYTKTLPEVAAHDREFLNRLLKQESGEDEDDE